MRLIILLFAPASSRSEVLTLDNVDFSACYRHSHWGIAALELLGED